MHVCYLADTMLIVVQIKLIWFDLNAFKLALPASFEYLCYGFVAIIIA